MTWHGRVAGPLLRVAVILGWPQAAPAQTVAIPDTPSCPTCRLVISRVMVFGDTSGPGEMPAYVQGVLRDDRGRYFVGGRGPDLPLVYGPRGQFLARVGAHGQGPEELQVPALVSALHDTLWVLDGHNARVTGYHVGDAVRAVESWRILAVIGFVSAVRTNRSNVVANVFSYTRSGAGIPLYAFRPDGRRIAFGETEGVVTSSTPKLVIRALSVARGGGVWAGEASRYRITHYDEAGHAGLQLERSASWFPPGDGSGTPPDPDRAPGPTLRSIRETPDGLLWVVSTVADAEFQEGVRSVGRVQSPQ